MVAAAVPAVFLDVLTPNVALAIWGRALSKPILREARRLAHQAPSTRTGQGDPVSAVMQLFAGFHPMPHHELVVDILLLADLFAEVSGSSVVRLRLDAVADESCALFHADAVHLRLLCTYCGDGTEWLPRAGGAALAYRLRDIPPVPASILRLPLGAAAIFRGEAGRPDHGCIHRSPPMSRDAQGRALRPRLLLTIDQSDEG